MVGVVCISMKSICMYCNKGGVAKTTTLFNLAAYISKENKKVLIIDFDQQCNLTELFFAADPKFNDPKYHIKGTSIFEAFRSRFAGEGSRVKVRDLELPNNENYPNLSILRGDFSFGAAEEDFSNAWKNASGSHLTHLHEKNNYNSIRNLLDDLVEIREFEYIFCDLGPNINYATRLAFLSCDGFFIPVFPDRFNHQAINLMFSDKESFPESIFAWIDAHRANKRFFPPEIPAIEGSPLFLGSIMTKMNWDPSGNNQSPSDWEHAIRNSISSKLHHNTKKISWVRAFDPSNPFISIIDFLGPLPSIAQAYGKGIFDLSESDLKGKGNHILGQFGLLPTNIPKEWVNLCKRYKDSISLLANYLIKIR